MTDATGATDAISEGDGAVRKPRRHWPRWLTLAALPRELRLLTWGVVFFVIVIALVVAFSPPRPLTLVAASVRSETLRLTIHNPDEASFRLPRARVNRTAANGGSCVRDVVFRPDQGDSVTYTREIGGPLIIRVDGRVSWHSRARLLGKSHEGAYITVDPSDRSCFSAAHVRLPIAGAMTIGLVSAGDAAEEPSMPVLRGQFTVYGRAVASILGVSLRRLERMTLVEPESLYLADTVSIPAGSQIGRAFFGDRNRANPEIARWWGFVDADMTPSGAFERGLLIEASTNASSLELIPPAPRVQLRESSRAVEPGSARADIISLTLGAQLAGDPNLRWLFAMAGVVIAIVGVLANVLATVLPVLGQRAEKNPTLPSTNAANES